MARKTLAIIMISASTMLALLTPGATRDASAADPFGPVESRAFLLKSGTTLEKPGQDCMNNHDVLLIHGTNVANAKSVDVTPKTYTLDNKYYAPTTACVAPNCKQVYISIDPKDPAGTRTVTLKSSDGRTVTTTFDVPESAGRCDVPKKAR